MKIKINKHIILESYIITEEEILDELEDQEEPKSSFMRSAAYMSPAVIGAAGTAYALNKQKVDAKVKEYASAGATKAIDIASTGATKAIDIASAGATKSKDKAIDIAQNTDVKQYMIDKAAKLNKMRQTPKLDSSNLKPQDFKSGVANGYTYPGRFQKNNRSSAEVLGHKLGQGTRRLQKRVKTILKRKK